MLTTINSTVIAMMVRQLRVPVGEMAVAYDAGKVVLTAKAGTLITVPSTVGLMMGTEVELRADAFFGPMLAAWDATLKGEDNG